MRNREVFKIIKQLVISGGYTAEQISNTTSQQIQAAAGLTDEQRL